MSRQTTPSKRVLVVDDQVAFAESLEVAINAEPDLRCVGTVGNADEAMAVVADDAPSVVVMDVVLPGMDGIEATRRIVDHHPDVGVVVLTGVPDATALARAASAGARAFLLKDSSLSEILDAIRQADRSPTMGVGSTALTRLLERNAEEAELTNRELEVLGLLAQGRQPKQIAYQLGITVNTCRGYVKNVLAKLGAHSALEAVIEAHRRGLISLDG